MRDAPLLQGIAPDALPGRAEPVLQTPTHHLIFGNELHADVPGAQTGYFALGCFWGAEKLYWDTDGVVLTAVGYLGGTTPNPTYEEVCSGLTGHAETVLVKFRPEKVNYTDLVRLFFENHDPTQGMRQGNDIGTQYRSMIGVTSPAQRKIAEDLRTQFADAFTAAGYTPVTTQIIDVDGSESGTFYFAEAYHQQYGEANDRAGRRWYCPIHATGVRCGSA